MRVTLQLTPDAARRAREPRDRSAPRRALSWLTHPLEPIHPDTSDPSLATFFTIDVADAREAAALVKRLCEDPNVESAYIKPADEPA